jgi:hypothetical protein
MSPYTPSATRYMGFRHPVTGKIGRWIVGQSPHFFCGLTDFSKFVFIHCFNAQGVKATCDEYADDCPLRAATYKDMQMAFKIMGIEA